MISRLTLKKVFRYCIFVVLVIISLPSQAQLVTTVKGWGQSNTSSADRGRAVCTDASGNVYITGKFYTNAVDFGAGSITPAGLEDGFVAKFNSSGTCQWSIRFGSASTSEEGLGIATDGSYVYVTGYSTGVMTVGSSATTYPLVGTGTDGFVMKLDASTAAVSWVTRFGGGNTDQGHAICLDGSGNVYISGVFRTTDVTTATFGSFTRTVQGAISSNTSDLFVAKLNSSGTFQWVSTGGLLGSNDNINGSGLCYVPSSGEIVVVGNNRTSATTGGTTTATYSTSSPASTVTLNNSSSAIANNEDFVLLEVNASDGTFLSGVDVGGDNIEGGLGVTYDAFTGDVFFCGYFYSPSVTFPGNSAITNGSGGVKANGMYGRYNVAGNSFTWIKEMVNTDDVGTADDNIRGIASDGVGGIFITGNFNGTTKFTDAGTGISVTTGGSSDIFLAKVSASNGYAQWVKQGSGSTGSDIGYGVGYGSSGASVWITGNYGGTTTFSPLSTPASAGGEDIYLVKVNDQPTVTSVSVPANGSYKSGNNLDFTVNYNTAVTVTGTPYISITVGASSKNASYVSGSGTAALLFRYTIVSGDNDADGIAVGSSITLNSGTITNTASSSVNALLTLNSVGSTTSVLVDGVAPTVSSINRQTPATASTNATSLVYRVTFSESVTGVGISDFALTATGTATGTIASVSASSGTTIDVTVNSVSGDGTLRLDLNASGTGIADAAGNAISGGYTSGQTYTLDHTAPTVSSINRQTPATASTNATSLVYRVTFSESVSNVDIADFGLTATGTAAGSIASVSASSGTTIDVTVNSVSGDGTLRLDLNASGTGIVDGFSNAISGGYTSSQTYTLDHTAPTVSSINRQTPSGANTNATSLVYRVTYSESVSGVDITDFSLTATGSATGSIASVSASSGTTIDVTVNTVSGNGTLRLDMKTSGTGITDAVSNAISGGFSTGQTYIVDNTAPTVSSINRQTPSGTTTNATSLVYRVTFSESVSGVDIADFSLTATGTAAGSIASVSASSGTTIDVTVNTVSGDGTLRLDLKASGTGITDAAGNAISGGYTSGQTYTLDHTSPTVSSINRLSPAGPGTNATSVVYRITFSETVTGVDISDFALTATGTAAGSVATVSSSVGSSIDVTVNTITGDGTLRLDLNSSGTGITDAGGNTPAGYTSGQTYTIDKTAPSVSSINRQTPSGATTNATTLVYRITFSESVVNVDNTDFSLTATGTATGSIASVSASSGTTIDVTVNSVSGNGTLRLDLNSSGTSIADAVGNGISAGYTSGQTYTIDNTAPSVSSINRQTPSGANTNATTLVYRVTFSESVSGVDISDFALTATGTASGSIASVSASSGTTIDVTVNTVSGDGTLRLDLNASGTGITDAAGNAISAGYTSGQSYTLDNTAPSVSSINRQTPSGANTNATTLVYRVTFSESVSNVDITDFSLTATGTAAGSIASVSSSSGTTIDVTVNTVTGDGTLRLDLKSSGTGITDATGNAISGGYTSGQTYTLDHTVPFVSSINRLTPASASTTSATLIWRVTFNENVSNVDISDFSLTTTGASSGTISSVSASSGTTIDVTITGATGSGTLRLDLNASGTGIVDDQGNAIAAGYTSGQTYAIATPGMWTGATSTDYSVASNWDDNTVPTGSTNITIPTGAVRMPVLSAASAANNITLQNATTLSLNGKTFTVNGNITVAGSGKLVGSASSTLNLLGTGTSTLSFDQSSDGTSNAVANLTINGTGAVNTLSNKLNIYTLLTITAGNLNLNGNNIVLRSTSIANTAMVAPVTGTISYGSGGKFTAERYIPLGKRAYRLLAPGVSGSVNGATLTTIYQNWQNSGTYTAGIGTHITGDGTNGTDATVTGQASMFTYTPGALNYTAVTSTNQAADTLSAIRGYRLFIRGDRASSNLSTANNTGNGTPNVGMNAATTLSASGRLLSGTIVFDKTKTTIAGADGWQWEKSNAPLTTNAGVNDFSLIANPYLAMVDWNTVALSNLSTTYYIWDPNKNLRGGYESYNRGTGIASASTISRYIQPGQAFFVQTTGANPSLTITENDKNTTSGNLLNAFRVAGTEPRFDITLSYASRPADAADNCVAVFDNSFSASVGPEDSYKMLNPDDNLMIVRNNTPLSVEGRPLVVAGDTVALRLSGIQRDSSYNITIRAEHMTLPVGYSAYLEDSYTNTATLLNTSGITVKQFVPQADSASYYNRFRIVFRNNGPLAIDVTSLKAYGKGTGNEVAWTNTSERNVRNYVVERSSDGSSFSKMALVLPTGSNGAVVNYSVYDASPLAGDNYYRIRITGLDGGTRYSPVARVSRGVFAVTMNVYPNPVTARQMVVQLSGLKEGKYKLVLYNAAGQQVMEQEVQHAGGNGAETMNLPGIATGIYRLQLNGNGVSLQQKIIIQ